MDVPKEIALAMVAALVAGVSIRTSIGDHLGALLERPVTVAEPESGIVYTTSSDPQLTVGYWSVRTWQGQERAEAHSPEQEQPDRGPALGPAHT
jgi:hypothetical protein